MPNFVKCLGAGLLVTLLAACDNAENATPPAREGAPAAETTVGRTAELLPGKVFLTLPTDMTDQSGKLGTQTNNMRVYANASGQKAAIVITGDNTPESLPVLSQRLEEQQRSRDGNLQVITNKAVEINGQTWQQLDSIITSGGQQVYSSVVLGKVDNQLLTLQIMLPADNQQQAQAEVANILQTLRLQ